MTEYCVLASRVCQYSATDQTYSEGNERTVAAIFGHDVPLNLTARISKLRPNPRGSIGDLHQPMHVSYADDKGGNKVKADAHGCNDNLHSVWDTCIPRDMMMEAGLRLKLDRGAFGDLLWGEVTAADRYSWLNASGPVIWGKESYNLALAPATEYCVLVGDICQYSATDQTYSGGNERTVATNDDYEDRFSAIVRARLKQAGVRLGAMLNDVFGG